MTKALQSSSRLARAVASPRAGSVPASSAQPNLVLLAAAQGAAIVVNDW